MPVTVLCIMCRPWVRTVPWRMSKIWACESGGGLAFLCDDYKIVPMCPEALGRQLCVTQGWTGPSLTPRCLPTPLRSSTISSQQDLVISTAVPGPRHLIHVFHPIPAQEEVGSLVHKMSILIIEGWAIGLGRGECKNIATSLPAPSKVTFAGTLGSTSCVA